MQSDNILIISAYWPTHQNSISGIFVVQQVAAFIELGLSITVLLENTFGRPSSPYLSAFELGLPIDKVEIRSVTTFRLPEQLSKSRFSFRLNSLLSGECYRRELNKLIESKCEFAGVILHGGRYTSMSSPKWRDLFTCKVVGVLHGVDPLLMWASTKKYGRGLYSAYANEVDAVVLVGSPLRNYASSLGIPVSKQKVVNNGTILTSKLKVETYLRQSRKVRVVSVSNLTKIKGVDLNLIALAKLANKHPDLCFEYRIVGEGPERGNLERLAKELNIDESVKFLGRLPYERTMLEMSEADIFSLPSWGEAFGIVYLEAMARGKPIIGCYQNGAEDIINDGEQGYLVEPQNIESLSRRLEFLMCNSELRIEMGRRGAKRVKDFTWKANALKMLKLLGFQFLKKGDPNKTYRIGI